MNSQNSGFTLLEMLVVVAILGVVTAIALPSFTTLISSNRLTTSANDLLAATMNARSEAIKRGKRVVVCKSSNGTACDNSLSWNDGWIVFVDDDNNGSRDSGEVLLRVGSPMKGVTATSQTNVANYISYSNRGRAGLISGGAQTGTITLCATGQVERLFNLTGTGQVGVTKGAACS